MSRIRVYFAAAMLGDRSNLEDNRKILRLLEEKGYEILTKWVVEEKLDIERGVTPEEVFERDIKTLNICDIVVADVSYPSLGVGFEIAYALLKGKKVIAFCREDRFNKTSALIRGITWKNFKIIVYNEPNKLVEKLVDMLK